MNRLSYLALLASAILLLWTGFVYYPKWKQPNTEATISWDASGYYMYLPAIFIYRDIKHCSFQDSVLQKYHPTPDFQQAWKYKNGNYVMKYSSGQALMELPFFAIAHAWAGSSNRYPADGFSIPYQFMISVGMMLYALLGLYYLRKLLRRYYSDAATAFAILAIVFGSNYLNYAAIDGAMTHNTLFTLYTILLYNISLFYERPTKARMLFVGALAGLATLVRPTEILSLILIAFWDTNSIKERWNFYRANLVMVLAGGISFALIYSIQLIYWKTVAGTWLVYSYGNEGFDWLSPHVRECLVSYRSGWLTYSPVMILGLIGLTQLRKRQMPAIIAFSLLFMYVCFSWQTWWYGGSLGQRAMVQSYPVFAFAIAALFQNIRKLWLKWLIIVFTIAASWFNLWVTHAGHRGGLLRVGEMNKEYYWAIFGRSAVAPETQFLLDNRQQNPGTPANIKLLSTLASTDTLSSTHPQTKEFEVQPGKAKWLRAQATFTATNKEWDIWKMARLIVRFYKNGQCIDERGIRIFRVLKDGETKSFWVDAPVPKDYDKATILVDNGGSDKVLMVRQLQAFVY